MNEVTPGLTAGAAYCDNAVRIGYLPIHSSRMELIGAFVAQRMMG